MGRQTLLSQIKQSTISRCTSIHHTSSPLYARSHRMRPLPKSAQRSIARKGLLFHSLMRYLCTSWEAGRLLSSQRFWTVVVTLASSGHLLSSAARRSAQSPSISRFSCLVCRASERDFSPSHACDPRGVGTLLRSFRGDSLCF